MAELCAWLERHGHGDVTIEEVKRLAYESDELRALMRSHDRQVTAAIARYARSPASAGGRRR